MNADSKSTPRARPRRCSALRLNPAESWLIAPNQTKSNRKEFEQQRRQGAKGRMQTKGNGGNGVCPLGSCYLLFKFSLATHHSAPMRAGEFWRNEPILQNAMRT